MKQYVFISWNYTYTTLPGFLFHLIILLRVMDIPIVLSKSIYTTKSHILDNKSKCAFYFYALPKNLNRKAWMSVQIWWTFSKFVKNIYIVSKTFFYNPSSPIIYKSTREITSGRATYIDAFLIASIISESVFCNASDHRITYHRIDCII